MRSLVGLFLLMASASVLPAQQGGGRLPPGWQARLDQATARIQDLTFTTSGSGFHATSGPAAIYFHQRYQGKGQYELGATFTQTRAPQHPEAYGIFFGGRELTGPDQAYYYFLVRGDGRYTIKHRQGGGVQTIRDWTEAPALKAADQSGRATNVLRVVVNGQNVRFLANDQEVASLARSELPNTDGQAGIRVNHNLDVEIDGFLVRPLR